MKILSLIVFFFLFSFSAFSLVEYDDETIKAARSKAKSRPVKRFKSTKSLKEQISTDSSDFSIKDYFENIEFKLRYETLDVGLNSSATNNEILGKVNTYNMDLRLDTPYDFYVAVGTTQSKSEDINAANKENNRGAIKYQLGLDWYKDRGARLGIYLGHIQGQEDSQFASSRNDQFIGFESSKQIKSVVVGIGYDLRMTGTPKNSSEVAIGNISRLSGGLSWIVSNDIRFSFLAHAYKIAKSDDTNFNTIEDDITFSVLIPSIHLQLFKSTELELGANIRTNKADLVSDQNAQDFINSRLLDLPGSYGNSFYAGLNFNI